jgi:5-(carboxyamino)imidazole ribonucleotide synthase
LECEVSVIVARNAQAQSIVFPVVENQHRDGILAVTLAPARIGGELAGEAQAATRRIVQDLNYQGVLAVEYFVTGDGKLLANEMAPRPHNSGHYSIDACAVSQFEQQVRALCNLPLVEPTQHSPAVMMNLLGDLWRGEEAPHWSRVYGKHQARPGRKMGHLTCTASELPEALRNAELAYAALSGD